jgi:hypothetical protein
MVETFPWYQVCFSAYSFYAEKPIWPFQLSADKKKWTLGDETWSCRNWIGAL